MEPKGHHKVYFATRELAHRYASSQGLQNWICFKDDNRKFTKYVLTWDDSPNAPTPAPADQRI